MKLDRKQNLNVLHQVFDFWTDRKNKMAALAYWCHETFSTSPLDLLNGIQRNLTESKISTSSTQLCFGPIRKTRWPPWPPIGRDIFDFSSESAERNSTKLDKKQDLKCPLPSLYLLGQSVNNWLIPEKGDTLYLGAQYGPFGPLVNT